MNKRALTGLTAVVAVLVVFGLALFISRPSPHAELERVVADGQTSAPVAFAAAGINASRACVFGPYSTADAISDELGFAWNDAAATGIDSSDGHELVVAADDDRVVAWALVTRPDGSSLLGGDEGCQPVSR